MHDIDSWRSAEELVGLFLHEQNADKIRVSENQRNYHCFVESDGVVVDG